MSEKKTPAQLEQVLLKARETYFRVISEHRVACENLRLAKQQLNEAQSNLNRAVYELRKAAPQGSDWSYVKLTTDGGEK